MTYYTPDNPNHALVFRPKKHPVWEGIRIALIVLVSILLVLSLTLTLFSASVRMAVTPENVYLHVRTIHFEDFPLPYNGSFTTISQLMLQTFNNAGFNLQESDIDLLFDQFSIPVIFARFAQDFVDWFLFDGSRPVLNPDEIASIALSNVDESIMAILYFLGDPAALLGKILVTPLSAIDTDSFFDRLEPLRLLFSADALAMLISGTLVLAVLLYCLCRCRFMEFCLPLWIVILAVCLLIGTAGFLLPAVLPYLTVAYAEYLTDPLISISFNLWRCSLIGIVIGFFSFSVWFLRRILLHLSRHGENLPTDPAGF